MTLRLFAAVCRFAATLHSTRMRGVSRQPPPSSSTGTTLRQANSESANNTSAKMCIRDSALASCADENTKKGIEMVLRSFKKLLEDEGIEAIDPKDEEFDPAFCEAILSEPAAEGVEPGYVKEVFVKGYRRGDKVLRYAQVKVTT